MRYARLTSVKKTTRYAEINHKDRVCFLRRLREWVSEHGSRNVVYFDESGFAAESYRPHAYAKRGVLVHGKVTGNHKKGRINLIMAQRGREWLAPMLFESNCTHQTVAAWMEKALIPELRPNSLVIMDNAPFHNKPQMKAALEANGHTMLPLPKYSPDLNPIEQTFAILKRRRQQKKQSLEILVMGNL